MSMYDPSRLKVRIEAPSLNLQQRDLASFSAGVGETIPAAVLVFHGIGEEVKFGTLSSAASLLLTEAEERGAALGEIVIRSVAKNDQSTDLAVRAELQWTEKDGTKRKVHVYEVYWAPLTMGKVTYWETMGFLLSAGWNGMRGAISSVLSGRWLRFERWLFGEFRELPITPLTLPLLVMLMLMVAFIIGAIAMAISAVAGVTQKIVEGKDAATEVHDSLSFIYAQVSVPWNWIVGWLHASNLAVTPKLPWGQPSWQTVAVFLAWLLGIGAAYWLQGILSTYVGSLVAYLSPYKDSKWEELRNAIQQRGLDIAKVVYDGYSLPSGWIPQYDRIVILGHSLGSVIAYDTLNAMINIEAASLPAGIPNPVVERTRSLITFGSPLDKTAFLFRIQLNARRQRQDMDGFLREMMVSAVQPLITDYKLYRYEPGPPRYKPKWINIWSPCDVISGKLGYYDHPAHAPYPEALVQNKIDWQSWIPLYAHLQYWTKKMLRQTAYDELFSVDAGPTLSPAAAPDSQQNLQASR
jgi:hypothetical protein